jgi:putative DNA primase/helicase
VSEDHDITAESAIAGVGDLDRTPEMTASTAVDSAGTVSPVQDNGHGGEDPRARLTRLARERNALNRTSPIDGILDWDHRGRPTVNIVRLAAAIEDGLKFRAGPDGRLYRYAAGVYLPDGEEVVRLKAQAMLASMYRSNHVNEVVRFYLDREGATPLSFDPDEALVMRTRDGIVNIHTWQVEPYTFESANLVQIPWSLRTGAACPGIDRFLMDCFYDDRVIVDFLYAIAGYLALTRNPLRLAFLMFGATGHNGKSIFLHLLERLLGPQNVASVPLQRLGGEDRFSPAQLVGKLANICGDIGPQTAKDMSLFKQLTGGDPIHAEHKFGQPFKFVSGATPIFSANEFPGSPDTTKAYKGRWIAVEWPREFVEDARMERKLKLLGEDRAEMEGFALQAAIGAKRVIDAGSFEPLPEAVRACTERFWRAIDSFEAFVDDKLVLQPHATVPGKAVFAAYKQFCQDNGYKHTLGRNRFYEKMNGLPGVYRDMAAGGDRPFVGVRLAEIAPLALAIESTEV